MRLHRMSGHSRERELCARQISRTFSDTKLSIEWPPMKPIELKPARGKLILLLSGSLAFVGLGIFFSVAIPGDLYKEVPSARVLVRIIGIISALFFGACAIEAIRQMLDTRPRLIIDDRGIFDRTLYTPVIPWSSITAAQIMQIRRSKFIALHLSDAEERYKALSPIKRMMSSANQGLGFTRFNLNITALNISAEALLEIIKEQLASR